MKNGKSPGIDGLSIEFFKTFWTDIKNLLFNAYLDCIKKWSVIPYNENWSDNLVAQTQ